MIENKPILSWLLGDDNPGVRLRALTVLCGYPLCYYINER